MQLINTLGNRLVKRRMKQLEHFKLNPSEVQQKVLLNLLRTAQNTVYGKKHHFRDIRRLSQFQEQVPLNSYEDLLPYIKRLFKGEQNVLWPSIIKNFAKSSGTTSDTSKMIPVSQESLHQCHYQGGRDMLALYVNNYPEAALFTGKNLSIGGSQESNFSNRNARFYIGNISAIVMKNLPAWAQFSRTPGMEITMMADWDEKIRKTALVATKQNVTSLAGSPMWMLLLLQYIFEEYKLNDLREIWPNLEVFFHGSVSFTPYRPLYNQIGGGEFLRYLEIYNATEGFFGLQDRALDPSLLLMLNYGIFYEFIPVEDAEKANPCIISLDQVEVNRHYTMVISTNSGLWRYKIGDTIKFTERKPYRFIISGRTKHCINIFGEDLFIDHAEKALAVACDHTGAVIRDYTAAPRYYDRRTKGYHEWLVEFARSPGSLQEFASILDQELCKLNDDYKAKRNKNAAIEFPVVHELPSGSFLGWLKKHNKLGGQHKIPRLSNNRDFVEELLEMNLNPSL